jgi:hypothetical protein
MFIDLYKLLPVFDKDAGGAAGNTAGDKAGENGKDKTEKPDDAYAKIESDLEASRQKLFADEGAEGVKAEESAADKQPAAPSKIEGLQTVDDKFIESSTTSELFKDLNKEDVEKVLKTIKGSQVDAKILKNYVHAQITLDETKRQLPEKKVEPEPEETFDNFNVSSADENFAQLDEGEKQKLNQAKQYALYNKLKGKYKDLTLDDLKDEDSINEYLSTLQVNKPLAADDFKTDFRKTNSLIDKETNEYVDRAVNFGDYMRKDAKEIVDKFTASLKAKGIDPKELEVTIDEKWIVQNIIKTGDKLNTDMIGYYRNNQNIPILNKDKFHQALIEKFDGRVAELTKLAGIKEYITGKRKKEANPSISNSDTTGTSKVDLPVSDLIPTKEFPGFENIDKALAANRKKIFENNESVYPDS